MKGRDPISNSQIHFASAILMACYDDRLKGMKGGLMKEKNFKESQVDELEAFVKTSQSLQLMLDIHGIVRKSSDLSCLWFKEFYLELSKKIQFPISTSLPSILTEFALESNRDDILQEVYYALDIYNDAATNTLYRLKSQVIYDEIEAEVNLCFDQFMFKLGQKIFVHYKKVAAFMNLPTDLKTEAFGGGVPLLHRDPLNLDTFEAIMKQKNFTLLGRSIDISKLIAQISSYHLKCSIQAAITRFESSDLTYLMELESLINNARTVHKLLSKFLELDGFDDILDEADERLSLQGPNGRIVNHSIRALICDLIANYNYNTITNRWIRSAVIFAPQFQKRTFPKTRVMYLYGTKVYSRSVRQQQLRTRHTTHCSMISSENATLSPFITLWAFLA